jgi:hypothetical protein
MLTDIRKVGCKMTNYNTLKEYEAHKEPLPSYEEWQSYDKCADMLIDVNNKWLKTIKKNKQLQKQIEQAVTLIKDGRFIEALRVLENEDT